MESCNLDSHVVAKVIDRLGRRRKVIRKTLVRAEEKKMRDLEERFINGAVESSSHHGDVLIPPILGLTAEMPDNIKNFPVLAFHYTI